MRLAPVFTNPVIDITAGMAHMRIGSNLQRLFTADPMQQVSLDGQQPPETIELSDGARAERVGHRE